MTRKPRSCNSSSKRPWSTCTYDCLLYALFSTVSGHYRITWTLKNGGWPRYIATNLAGMYRNVFGINNVKGLQGNDFKFIPHKPVAAVKAGTMNGSHTEIVRAAR